MAKDALGSFHIPENLWKVIENLPDPVPVTEPDVDHRQIISVGFEWTTIRQMKGTPAAATGIAPTHTIRGRREHGRPVEWSCTCQSFRIRKQNCKHIDQTRDIFFVK